MSDEQLKILKELNDRQKREEEKKQARLIKWKRQFQISFAISTAIVGSFAFLTCIWVHDLLSSPEAVAKREKEKRCGSEMDAFTYSRVLVRKNLRSPTTAEFPFLGEEGVTAESTECGEFTVHGVVDGQNGFGAIIRQRYTAYMHHDAKDDSWRGTFVFDEE